MAPHYWGMFLDEKIGRGKDLAIPFCLLHIAKVILSNDSILNDGLS